MREGRGDMSHWIRRKRLVLGLLKPVLSLSLVFASFLMLHRLAEKDALGLKAGGTRAWCGSDCFSFKHSVTTEGPTEQDAQRSSNATAASWDSQVLNCTENASLRSQDWFRRLDSRFHQFVLRKHCRYFPMRINHPEKCARGHVHLLIVVKSVIEQHDRREAVRLTWGREYETEDGSVRTVFLLGTASTGKDSRNLQRLLEYEDRLYGDILQWDFMDTFFNLTLKEVNFLKWFNIYCPRTRFIFKGDDDVFVNTHNLLELIKFKTEERRDEQLFVGDIIYKAGPIRNRQSKYYIPKELYDGIYPPYAGGGGFLMSGAMARSLFLASETVQLYPIDDVFLGMCLQKLGSAPEPHPAFRTFGVTRRKVSPLNHEPCIYKQLIVVHKMSVPELLRMWNMTHDDNLVCARSTAI
ncbi:UDP-GlcNAc:betaGal beta-1,3-N-acetylglucosaminyltransferase 7, like [Boleophthalmus pectinirostris]|uniref:UDP-GlcNAc:betaGal beta-1,3-N-acetylglucosaminyltransferase 7, like n=1 Tax=Boleophthalmus pectinirostris TaxID=150288 RepID=UPI000A1C3192|nr:UDP-GlcNAc:betaGal beta-1,3-N-acetylglucosaminyltransferase 7, like [Boleophthalmus pectinirostris]